jgi:TP901 family phage tail tape measure protein
MPNLPPLRTQVGADVHAFTGGIGRAVASLGQFENGLAAAGAGLVVFAGVKGLAGATRAFADFDQQMAHSTAIMGDLTKGALREMQAQAIKTSETTVTSANDAARSYFFLASAGLDAKQSVAALPQVAKFAEAGMFDMAQATSLAVDAQSALGLKVKDAGQNLKNLTRVTDVLAKANELANANIEQFSEALTNKLAGRMRMLNIPLEQGVAGLAALAEQGVKGQRAGQGLTIVLRDLAAGAVRNEGAFRQLGIHVYDAQGNFRDLADILQDFEKALGGMTDEQKAAAFETLHINRRATDFLNILIGSSQRIREFNGELKNAAGTVDEIARKNVANLNDQMTLLKHTTHAAAIELGGLIAPGLEKDTTAVRLVLQDLIDELHKLNEEASKGGGESLFSKVGDILMASGTPLGQLVSARREWDKIRDDIITSHTRMQNANFKPPEIPLVLSPAARAKAMEAKAAGLTPKQLEEQKARQQAADYMNAIEDARLRLMEKDLGLTSRQLDAEREKLRTLIEQKAAAEEIAQQAEKIAEIERQRKQPLKLGPSFQQASQRAQVQLNFGGLGTPKQQLDRNLKGPGAQVPTKSAEAITDISHVLSDPSPFGKVTDALKNGLIPAMDEIAGKLHIGTGLLADFADSILTALGGALSKKSGGLGLLGTAISGFAGGFAAGGTIPAGRFGVVHPGEMIMTGPANVTPADQRSSSPQVQHRVENNYHITIKAIDSKDLERTLRERGGKAIVDVMMQATRHSTGVSRGLISGSG